jgi:hypothetical protein
MEQIFTLHYSIRSKRIEILTLSVINLDYCDQIEKEIKTLFENMNITIESINNVIHKFISNDMNRIIQQLKEIWNKYQPEFPFLITHNFGIYYEEKKE